MPQLVRIETQDLSHAKAGQPSRPIHGHTTYSTLESFSAQHGQLSSGVWEATAGAFRANCAGYVEFCHIVEGDCRVVDPDGTIHHLATGDSFVLPEGFTGHWEVDVRVKKVFFIAPGRTLNTSSLKGANLCDASPFGGFFVPAPTCQNL